MLGKQWLNRYATTNVRGTTIERGHIRQRKLDGVVTWYFDHVMESLPSMLQAALLLLGCALSRYLWEINIVIASVVLGTTLFGSPSTFSSSLRGWLSRVVHIKLRVHVQFAMFFYLPFVQPFRSPSKTPGAVACPPSCGSY